MFLNQKGDTIVEVLMCIAVISAVVGGAYTMTNRSVKNTQQAQEHSQALKVAETQVEQLKSYIAQSKLTPTAGQNFCMKITGVAHNQAIDVESFSGSNLTASLPLATDTSYPALCRIDDNGVSQRFSTGIVQVSNIFTVYVNWTGPTNGREQVSLSYRLYP